MKKRLVYQKPSLYMLNDNNALGYCLSNGSAAGGGEVPVVICQDGGSARDQASRDAICLANGSTNQDNMYSGCGDGLAVNSVSCNSGNTPS